MPNSKNVKRRHARHLAYQIVAQLPEETDEALLVLDFARKLLLHPLDEPETVINLKVVEGSG